MHEGDGTPLRILERTASHRRGTARVRVRSGLQACFSLPWRPDVREEAAQLGNLRDDFDFSQPPRRPLLPRPTP